MLFAVLPLLALFCAENDAATFITRIKGEIEAARANAANMSHLHFFIALYLPKQIY